MSLAERLNYGCVGLGSAGIVAVVLGWLLWASRNSH